LIKIKIIKKQINSRVKAGFVACPRNNLKLNSTIACQLNCSRFSGIDDEFLKCGKPGANQPLKERYYPSLEYVLGTYGENRGGGI
jgi:hypothetical protein